MKTVKLSIAVAALAVILAAFFSLWGKSKRVSVSIEHLANVDVQPQEMVTETVTQEGYMQEAERQEQSVSAPVENQSKEMTAEKKEPAAPAEKKESAAEKSQPVATGGIKNELVSWGFQRVSSRAIDTVVIHTTYNALGGDPYDYAKVLQEWKSYGVAPHYAIDRAGTIHQLVSDQNIAYHAGQSKTPDGRSGVNTFSIGIEVVNTEDGKFTDAQYGALNSLIANLKSKYKIKYVLGHSEIASARKTDPWGIEWGKVKK